jgi:hypothetical protein
MKGCITGLLSGNAINKTVSAFMRENMVALVQNSPIIGFG